MSAPSSGRTNLWQPSPNKRGVCMTGGRDQLCRPRMALDRSTMDAYHSVRFWLIR